MTEDENGGHGYMEHASIGGAIVHVFYADDKERCEACLHPETIKIGKGK